MMPVAKATAITQVTDPSCERPHPIGLSAEGDEEGGGLELQLFDWLLGWQRQGPQQTDIQEGALI